MIARWRKDHPFFDLIMSEDRGTTGEILVLTATAGLCQGFLIAVINSAAATIELGALQAQLLLLFLLLVAGFLVARVKALDRGAVVVEDLVRKLRVKIAARIRGSGLKDIEQIGPAWVLGVLSRDAEAVGNMTPLVLNGCSSLVTLVFACGYIALVSKLALAFSVGLVAIAAVYILRRIPLIEQGMGRASASQDAFLGGMSHLLDGFKAIKMNEARGLDLHKKFIKKDAKRAAKHMLGARRVINGNAVFSQVFFYCLLGVIVFGLPLVSKFDSSRITYLVAMILFLIGPITEVVSTIPYLAQADVAARNLKDLQARLNTPEESNPKAPSAVALAAVSDLEAFSCEGIRYQYLDKQGQVAFELGPLNLQVQPGELIFVVGGNGSGKSTLLKVLTGLYEASGGEILLNGVAITEDNRALFRSWFSAVYADFHLFDRLYGMRHVDPARVTRLLESVGISGKTEFRDGSFTQLDLSTGQRKRLALVVALLEDRPIFIFDEVAADQDPEFRKYFYDELLPELRAQGKTGLVVTHDDRYFHMADHLITLQDGKILREVRHEQRG